ncbi:hypothetical protein TSTA_059980 [Talaromyces stipitatus ATCC 10500]|uniref:F-box domain protein n=1 Tax=Talaromyces stipitatus (strain ATCC 10500 / CBS 375.48 / QM 6759 / NRRL 1006) TaxID=441959 RepID=B8LTC6_TALSN|nr:uncharacterized protein TSTA_059980 [Talaromyces stipitatus ATCC 10500]EED22500.1 hypothetical protein TSTA_059980 [Talaromyces stipitatus ATCC 10500]
MAKSQFDLGFLPRECPPYMAIFQTVQKMCRKQNQILEHNIDQAALSKVLCVFPHLKELTVHFCVPLETKPWLEAYIDLDMNVTEGLYAHHMQVIAQALSDRSSIHLRGFQIQTGHQYEISDLMSLSAHLQELLVGIRSLKMTQSESALELLSQWELNIDQLDMCDMMIDYDTLKRVFSANQPTLRSIGFHNVVVTEVPFEESASQLSVDILSELIGARRGAQGQATYCHCHSRHNGWRILWENEPLV